MSTGQWIWDFFIRNRSESNYHAIVLADENNIQELCQKVSQW